MYDTRIADRATACASPIALIPAAEHFAVPEPRARLRIRPGVYAHRDAWSSLPPWDRYLARVHAVAMTWQSPIFSHESAAALLGLPLFGEPTHVHVVTTARHARRYGDVVVHARSDLSPVLFEDGTMATSAAITATELSRELPPAFGLATADAALRTIAPQMSGTDLLELALEQPHRRGRRLLRWVMSRANVLAESPGESVSRAVIEWLGYAAPELQVTFETTRSIDRVDLLWRRERVIGESDGYGKYGTEDRETRRLLFAEKRREDRLRSLGFGFARWDWSDAVAADPLDHTLRAAGLRPVTHRNVAMLATLRRNPRSR